MRVSIFTVFWANNNSERLNNVKFTQKKLTLLTNFLKKCKIDCTFTIFDFSVEKKIEDSIHIPYDPTKYDRSKKMNIALDYLHKTFNPDIVCQFDSDVFLMNENFFNFLDILKNIQKNQFFIANVLDIQKESMSNVDFDKITIDTRNLSVKNRLITGLGAVFIIHMSNLISVGGFDERFEVWGGEDDDLADRFLREGLNRYVCHFNYFHLYHKSLSENIEMDKKYQEQIKILKSDKTNVRPTFLNSYNTTQPLIKFSPLSLMTNMRFDLGAKTFYAKYKNFNTDYPKKMYLEHIKVWNNFFEESPRKTSPQDFIDHFDKTIESIKNDGFVDLENNYIPLKNNSPYNGAHRVASAIVTNQEVYGKENDMNGQYNCSWEFFKGKNLGEEYMDEIALEFVRMKKNTFTVSIFSSDRKNLSYAEKILKEYSKIIYEKEVNFSELGKLNYIIELYRYEPWVGSFEDSFSGANYKKNCCFNKSNKIKFYLIECENINDLIKCKKEIRDVYNEENHSVHINDTYDETVSISTTILNKNSLHYLNNYPQPNFKNFKKLINEYKLLLGNENKNNFVVSSSAVLSLFSLRDCEDIDFLTIEKNFINYKKDGINSHESQIQFYSSTKDDIILNPNKHLYWNGIKFATVDIIKSMKINRNELKDTYDVNLIKDFYEKKN
jgi:hypothetical protein